MNERFVDPLAAVAHEGLSVFFGKDVKLIDVSLELDASKFRMRTYDGFKKDMQFEVEIIKDYDDGGLGQIVRGAHMRLHAGTHVDAPSHMLKGGKDIHDIPLQAFIGPAVVADIRHCKAQQGIFAEDLERAVGATLQRGDRVLLRSDINKEYDGSPEWVAKAPYLSDEAVAWCVDRGVSLVGYDFFHGQKPPGADPASSTSRKLHSKNILTMPYLTNLASITKARFMLIGLPLKMKSVEASPIRAIVLEGPD